MQRTLSSLAIILAVGGVLSWGLEGLAGFDLAVDPVAGADAMLRWVVCSLVGVAEVGLLMSLLTGKSFTSTAGARVGAVVINPLSGKGGLVAVPRLLNVSAVVLRVRGSKLQLELGS